MLISSITRIIKHISKFNGRNPSLTCFFLLHPLPQPCCFSFDGVSLLCPCLCISDVPRPTSPLPYFPGPSLPLLQPTPCITFILLKHHSHQITPPIRSSEIPSCTTLESSAHFPGSPRGPCLPSSCPSTPGLSTALFPPLLPQPTLRSSKASHF